MLRLLTHILVFTALILQVGMGSLPSDEPKVCIRLAAETRSCCDSDDDCAENVERSCPCHGGCERCICVPTHDGRATLTDRPQTKPGHEWLVVAMDFGTPAPLPAYVPPAICCAPRPTESPPHLQRLRTTRLII